jgi:ligand-binding SRPBCC domain-containing protein
LNQRIQFEQWVPVPLERVFLFFANPRNLPRIMPPENGTELIRLKLVSPPRLAEEDASNTDRTWLAGVGSEIVTSFRVIPFLPLRAQWIALITEFEWNHHFADIQEQGPFKSFHHRHELTVEVRRQATGTIVRDVINYDLGFGWLGTLAQKLFISRQLQRTFEYRQRALEKLLG